MDGKKATTQELLTRAWNAIESSREHLKEFRRKQRAFDNSRAREEAGCMFAPKQKEAKAKKNGRRK